MEKTTYTIEDSKLMELFTNEPKDIYWAENALLKALPDMAKKATSIQLRTALEKHLEETEGQIKKLERVFEIIGEKAKGEKCEAMKGLVEEGEIIMKKTEEGAMRDAGIISAAQKVEHYEIASYGTLRTFATTLNLPEAATLLNEILEEEKATDIKLSSLAESTINTMAATEKK